MLEIDETFSSYGEWSDWASANRKIYDASYSDQLVEQIIENGIVMPITGAKIAPNEISTSNKDWREGLSAAGINSRARAVLKIIENNTHQISRHKVRIFAAEAVTPFALFMRGIFPRFLGSEYGLSEEAVRNLFPIQHEDLMDLTLPDDSFDIVTTNEVLEHVPDLDLAMREIARVLKPGGWHIGTVPFLFTKQTSAKRAEIVDGKVIHLLEPPQYHGNPVDPEGGSLVFELPAWDIIERAKRAGFSKPTMRFIASLKHGYISQNTGIFVFCAQK